MMDDLFACREVRHEEKQIEVSPEMLAAGLAAYDAWYASPRSDEGPIDGMLIEVFRAMAECRRIRVLSTPPLIVGRRRQAL